MRQRRSFTWVLLAYLVLILNLGPSLHRADLFGLHSHSDHAHSSNGAHSHVHSSQADSPHVHSQGDPSDHVACAHQQGHFDGVPMASRQLTPGRDDSEPGEGQWNDACLGFHDCIVCRFFDQYHVVIGTGHVPHLDVPAASSIAVEPVIYRFHSIYRRARAPPA